MKIDLSMYSLLAKSSIDNWRVLNFYVLSDIVPMEIGCLDLLNNECLMLQGKKRYTVTVEKHSTVLEYVNG